MSKQDHFLLWSDFKSTEMWQDKRLWHSEIFRYVCAVQPYANSGCQGFYAYAYSSIWVVYWDEEHLSCLTFFFPLMPTYPLDEKISAQQQGVKHLFYF